GADLDTAQSLAAAARCCHLLRHARRLRSGGADTLSSTTIDGWVALGSPDLFGLGAKLSVRQRSFRCNAALVAPNPGKQQVESAMAQAKKARAVGINHVALEVGDIEQALAFYGRLFDFKLRGKSEGAAFIDLGDQFIALQKGRQQPGDDGRHFGLVVDDKEAMREALAAAGVK